MPTPSLLRVLIAKAIGSLGITSQRYNSSTNGTPKCTTRPFESISVTDRTLSLASISGSEPQKFRTTRARLAALGMVDSLSLRHCLFGGVCVSFGEQVLPRRPRRQAFDIRVRRSFVYAEDRV